MHPKIKDSVQFFPIGSSTFHVYDRSTARHFKMGEDEVSWLKLFDGRTPKEHLAGSIPDEYRDDFFSYIEKMELIEGPKKREGINILKIRIARFDPSFILDALGKYATGYRRFLDVTVVPFVVINILFGLIVSSSANINARSVILTPAAIAIYIAAIAVTGVVHEFSHALVARSFGVRVPAVGIMLFLIQPTFYADVSAISLLSSRADRIAVLSAGVKSNNIIILLCLAAYLAFAGHEVAPYLLSFAGINFVLILINLIPFVEYDGYYIFQELLHESNFARHATTNVLSVGKRRAAYIVYFVASQITRFALVCLALASLRTVAFRIWNTPYINDIFLAITIAAYPILMVRSVRRAG